MPTIKFITKGLPPDFEEKKFLKEVTWAELIWAGITVGRQKWKDVIQHGYHSLFEIIYRFAILKANLSSTPKGEYTKSDAYKNLDPSEKSAISYFLGLSMAKLAAHRFLSVPWVVHLDCVRGLSIEMEGKNRPDLIGKNHLREWCVFEAKGRSNGISNESILKAKRQAQGIKSIDGKAPFFQGISISHFRSNILWLHLERLAEINSNNFDLEFLIGENQFLESYYQPFVSLIENNTGTIRGTGVVRVRGRKVNFVNLEEVDLDVGLDSRVLEIFTSDTQAKKSLMSIYNLCSQHAERLTLTYPGSNDPTFLGEDGVFVRLGSSWEKKR